MFVISSAFGDRQRTGVDQEDWPHGELMVSNSLLPVCACQPENRLVRDGQLEVIGVADLDTEAIVSDAGHQPARYVLRAAIAQFKDIGARAFAQLAGEFAFVFASAGSDELVAVRDHLGLSPLYYQVRGRDIRLSDSLDAFDTENYDREFIAEFIAVGGICNERTIWSGVSPVPAGSVLQWRAGRVRVTKYWSAEPTERDDRIGLEEAAHGFYTHVRDAVRRYLLPDGRTWAHLSGGLDSSTVVATADTLNESGGAANRLGGTLTITDTLGGGDDRRFALRVAQQFGIRNETIANDDHWAWKSDGEPLPHTDQPTRNYPFYSKFRAMHRIVRSSGGTTVLTGAGPDVYLPVTAGHIVDLVQRRRIRAAASELFKWTVATRSSLWRTAVSHVLRPMVRPGIENWGDTGKTLAAEWLTRRFWDEMKMGERLVRRPVARGHQYDGEVAWYLGLVGGSLAATWNTAPQVRMRHPLLHQPLLKFVLNLPYHLRTDSYHTKPLLRVAMRGVLPEDVRKRATKGSMLTPRLCWSFARERPLLTRLLKAPVLGDLGCIHPKHLLAAVDAAAEGRRRDVGLLFATLSLETWMLMRSGRCINRHA